MAAPSDESDLTAGAVTGALGGVPCDAGCDHQGCYANMRLR